VSPCARLVGGRPCGHPLLGHCLGLDQDGGITRCLTCLCPGYLPANDSAPRHDETGRR
jgi:hypothetical protein